MIDYQDISYSNYHTLKDKSGLYKINFTHNRMYFVVNDKFHNEFGAAYINNKIKQYWLNDQYYGSEDDYTDESWRRFCKLKVFQ